MKFYILFVGILSGFQLWSQDYFQNTSIRINEDVAHYEDLFKKIYENNVAPNLSIKIYQMEFSEDDILDGEEGIPSLIIINDDYLPVNLGHENKFEVKELVGGQLPELLIYAESLPQAYIGTQTYIVNISANKPFVLSSLGLDVSVLKESGKIAYFNNESESEQVFEYNYTKGINDLYIMKKMIFDEDGNCFDYIQALNYKEGVGFSNTEVKKKLPTFCAACFTGDMLVNISESDKKRISELKKGDKVLTFDFSQGMKKEVVIEEMVRVKHTNFIQYFFEHDTIISTLDHPYFLHNKGWSSFDPKATLNRYKNYSKVKQIELNDEFIMKNGKTTKLKSYKIIKETMDSYTITKLSEGQSFFVNNILVGTEELDERTNYKSKIIKRK